MNTPPICPKMAGYYCLNTQNICPTYIKEGFCYQCSLAVYKSAWNRKNKVMPSTKPIQKITKPVKYKPVQKIKRIPLPKITNPNCIHYWLIEPPDGTTSIGVCKFCGSIKEFYNAFQGIKSEQFADYRIHF